MDYNECILTKKASGDLEKIIDYISIQLHNPMAARNLINKIAKALEMITEYPNSCPIVNNEFINEPDIRKVLIDRYILYYSYDMDNKIISVLRIIYEKMNLEDIIFKIERM